MEDVGKREFVELQSTCGKPAYFDPKEVTAIYPEAVDGTTYIRLGENWVHRVQGTPAEVAQKLGVIERQSDENIPAHGEQHLLHMGHGA